MNRLQFLLTKLAEEASEVAQIALKTQQFGLDEVYQVDSNKTRCHAEINDLLAVVYMLNAEFDFGFTPNEQSIIDKAEKVNKYYQYSVDLGMVDAGIVSGLV